MQISLNGFLSQATSQSWPKYKRLILPVLLIVLFANEQTKTITINALADAFWAVSVFVAATLTFYHILAAKVFGSGKLDRLRQNPVGQILYASVLGAIPGCGGAIIVVTQFVSGQLRFGSVVAVLTATMGDAAFFLTAKEPVVGVSVALLSIVVGVVSGIIVDRIHGGNFLKPSVAPEPTTSHCCNSKVGQKRGRRIKIQGVFWRFLFIPGAVLGLLMAAQSDVDQLLSVHTGTIVNVGAILAFVLVVFWSVTTEVTNFQSVVSEDDKEREARLFQRVAVDTNFITSWVVVAIIGFEVVMHYSQIELHTLFAQVFYLMPLIGVAVGLIPGCGPQILVTTMYLNGSVPLSAQLGNAISNDGDALFPAIALAPKAALWATLYSSIPATLVAYGYFWVFE